MARRAHQHEAFFEHRLLVQVVHLLAAHHHRKIDRAAAHAFQRQTLGLVGQQHLDVGVALLRDRQAARHQPGRDGGRAGHPHHAARLGAQRLGAGQQLLQVAHHAAQRAHQRLAGRGQQHLARGAVQQLQAQLGFQRADALADRRLRQADGIARAGKATFVGDGEQHLQLAQADIHKLDG